MDGGLAREATPGVGLVTCGRCRVQKEELDFDVVFRTPPKPDELDHICLACRRAEPPRRCAICDRALARDQSSRGPICGPCATANRGRRKGA